MIRLSAKFLCLSPLRSTFLSVFMPGKKRNPTGNIVLVTAFLVIATANPRKMRHPFQSMKNPADPDDHQGCWDDLFLIFRPIYNSVTSGLPVHDKFIG